MWQKEFLLFYISQLWALHVFIKRQFFYIYTFSYLKKNDVYIVLNSVFDGCYKQHSD